MGGLPLRLAPGEILGIYDISNAAFEELFHTLTVRPALGGAPDVALDGRPFIPRDIARAFLHGVLFMNQLDVQSYMIPNLSLIDNLYLTAYRRVSRFTVIQDNLLGHVRTKYAGQFGPEAMDAEAGMRGADHYGDYQTQLKIYLERVRISAPRLIICSDPYEKSDDFCQKTWNDFFKVMSMKGTSVIIVSASANKLEDMCARVMNARAEE